MMFKLCEKCEDVVSNDAVECPSCSADIESETTVSPLRPTGDNPLPESSVQESARSQEQSSDDSSQDIHKERYDEIMENLERLNQESETRGKDKVFEMLRQEKLSGVVTGIVIKVILLVAFMLWIGLEMFLDNIIGSIALLGLLYCILTIGGFAYKVSGNCLVAIILFVILIFVMVALGSMIEDFFGQHPVIEEILLLAIIIPPIIYDVVRVRRLVKAKNQS